MKKILVLFGLVFFHLLLLFNLQFTAWPEMLSYPYIFSKTFNLYQGLVHPYPPLLTLMLSGVFSIFGYKIITLKIFTWILIIAGDLVFFKILRRVFKKDVISYLFLFFYVILQSFLDGNMLWFDNALVLPLLLAFYLIIKWIDKKNIIYLTLIGLFLSFAVLIKQTALIYVFAFFIIYVLKNKKIVFKDLIFFSFVPLVFLIRFAGYLNATNAFKDFWNWTVFYPLKYWSKLPSYVDLSLSKMESFVSITFLALLLPGLLIRTKKNKYLIPTIIFFVLSIVAIYPRFSYFHLQPVIPFYVLLLALLFKGSKKRHKKGLLFTYFIGFFIVLAPIAKLNWNNQTRFFDDRNVELVEDMKKAPEDASVLLIGLHSSYYVYSNTYPPLPWIDNFSWYFEVPGVQESTIENYKKNPPLFVYIRVPERGNWHDLGTYLPQKIVDWVHLDYTLIETNLEGIEKWEKNN